jgi:ribose 5-phosphate isomerase A
LSWREDAKHRASVEAARLVEDDQIVGLGSGSTIYYLIEELGRRIREEGLRICCIPTSKQTESQARKHKIKLTTLDKHPQIDIAIDGADQVDSNLNLIKGKGGALTREKIVDSIARFLIIVVDETKLTDHLGLMQPVPIEVMPFALKPVMNRIKKMGGAPVIRSATKTASPSRTEQYFTTDNGNIIIDAEFGTIKAPKKMEIEIKMIPGVIENGLFVNMAHRVYVGMKSGSIKTVNKEEAFLQ